MRVQDHPVVPLDLQMLAVRLDVFDRATCLRHGSHESGRVESSHGLAAERSSQRARGSMDRYFLRHPSRTLRDSESPKWAMLRESGQFADVREREPDETIVTTRHLFANSRADGLFGAEPQEVECFLGGLTFSFDRHDVGE